MAFLWAFLPPLAIGVVEKIAFNTSYFATFMGNWFMGGPAGGDPLMSGHESMQLAPLTPGRFITSPGLWIGFAIAAAFLMAAVRLRRYREPN
jgi:ABC-2 type transport system permease protein